MQNQLLVPFNSFAFNQTTQILLTNFTKEELREILKALIFNKQYQHLSQIIKATLFINLTHEVDRTFYFLHYSCASSHQLIKQRSNLIVSSFHSSTLDNILLNYNELMLRAQQYFEEKFQLVRTAVFNPDLPLPPTRRSTIAPRCQTVYQIILACKKASQFQEEFDQSSAQSIEYFFELLNLQAQMANIQLSSISDPLEHFSQLIFKFMVYRNSVLALNDISAFPKLTQTMEIWKNTMKPHYLKANNIFAEISNLKEQTLSQQYGSITPEILISEGYLNEYIQQLVDLSIDQELVAFCGHSQQHFGEFYNTFQEFILEQQNQIDSSLIKQKIQNWNSYGLKSSTLLKIIQQKCVDSQLRLSKYNECIRQDDYIETCAKIHGFLPNQLHLMECY